MLRRCKGKLSNFDPSLLQAAGNSNLNIRAAKYQLGACTMAGGVDFCKNAVAEVIRR
jgi:hypothetical protein